MKLEKMYTLNFGEVLDFFPDEHDAIKIIRVMGGWIFLYFTLNNSASSVFIPFNNEFQNNLTEN